MYQALRQWLQLDPRTLLYHSSLCICVASAACAGASSNLEHIEKHAAQLLCRSFIAMSAQGIELEDAGMCEEEKRIVGVGNAMMSQANMRAG